MNTLNLTTHSKNIDFDFYETDGIQMSHSSKIITKAVIETNPLEQFNLNKSSLKNNLKLSTADSKEMSILTKQNDKRSSPNSSDEIILGNTISDLTLFNCLAFNDELLNNKQMCSIEDKDYSDSSLSDSTITTVTSDFTTVSRLSSSSDSSCGSDFSNDPPTQESIKINKTKENCLNCIADEDGLSLGLGNQSSITSLNTVDDSDPQNSFHGAGNRIEVNGEGCIEVTNPDYEYYENEYDASFNQRKSNSSVSDSGKNQSIDNTYKPEPCANINTDIESTYEEESSKENCEYSGRLSRNKSTSTIEERLGEISLASHSSSNSSIVKSTWRGQNRFRSKRKELNLTFSREELIKIERDNTILLKKIMSYSKPRSVVQNHTVGHKKTSAAINRARQQKKIEQDNYILYSKINAVNRIKKVF